MSARVVVGLGWALGLLLVACASAPGPVAAPVAVMVCPEGQTQATSGKCETPKATPAASSAPLMAIARPPASVFVPMTPPAQRGDITTLRGEWMGEDSDGSASYELSVHSSGRFTQTITTLNTNSGRQAGSCFQEGTLSIREDQLVWFYQRNTCNTAYEGQEDPDGLVEQDSRHFVISMESYQIHYLRR